MPVKGLIRAGLVLLDGTNHAPPPGARREPLSRVGGPLTITLSLRSRASSADALDAIFQQIASGRRRPLSRDEFAEQFGARRSDIAAVRRFARANGFRVSGVSPTKRIVRLAGDAAKLAKSFGVNRVRYRLRGTAWNSFIGHLYVPVELADGIRGVFGFDESPEIRRHGVGNDATVLATTAGVSYTALEVAKLYCFPEKLDGRGQAVAIIALGGGFLRSDLRAYARALRLPLPQVKSVSVDGARNAPTGPTAAYDGEVTGDIETVMAIAPRARITVYFADNSPQGFFESVAAAVHDGRRRNDIVSISWGQAEVHWRRGTMAAFNQVLLEAAVMGVTVCCSSGDHGSFADAHDREAHVNFPGSSPYVLSCGGTTLRAERARIESESVWHNATGASGGGVSAVFPRPSWQSRARVPKTAGGYVGRGVPDVAANADPLTGYRIYGHGAWHVGAGTSASSPLWAGLIARFNEHFGMPIGLPTPFIYGRSAELWRSGAIVSITKGNNGLFRARQGWDCCTGFGSPRGVELLRAYSRHGPRKPK